jgi:hypothetical protein
MTIAILFQQSHYRAFKAFYTEHVQQYLRGEFPHLVSYTRFVALIPRVALPLTIYLQTQLRTCTGISFVDSISLAARHNARIDQHRVFVVDARRGKTSVGWFYGVKLHVVVNHRGEILAFCLTPGNIDDRRPVPRAGAPPVRQALWGSWLYRSGAGRAVVHDPEPLAGHQGAQEHARAGRGLHRQAAA